MGCGDTTETKLGMEECNEKDKAGHQIVNLVVSSAFITDGRKCGEPTCRKP